MLVSLLGIVSIIVFFVLLKTLSTVKGAGWEIMGIVVFAILIAIVCNAISLGYLIGIIIAKREKKTGRRTPLFYEVLFFYLFLLFLYYRGYTILLLLYACPLAVIAAFVCNYYIKSLARAIVISTLLPALILAIGFVVVEIVWYALVQQSSPLAKETEMIFAAIPFSFPYCFVINNVFSLWKRRDAKAALANKDQ